MALIEQRAACADGRAHERSVKIQCKDRYGGKLQDSRDRQYLPGGRRVELVRERLRNDSQCAAEVKQKKRPQHQALAPQNMHPTEGRKDTRCDHKDHAGDEADGERVAAGPPDAGQRTRLRIRSRLLRQTLLRQLDGQMVVARFSERHRRAHDESFIHAEQVCLCCQQSAQVRRSRRAGYYVLLRSRWIGNRIPLLSSAFTETVLFIPPHNRCTLRRDASD